MEELCCFHYFHADGLEIVTQESCVIYHRNIFSLLSKQNCPFLANLLSVLCFIWLLFDIESIQHFKGKVQKREGSSLPPTRYVI